MKYALTRSRRLSVSLQIGKKGELLVRAPYLYPTYLIDRFVASKSEWIKRRKKEVLNPRPTPRRFISDLALQKIIKQFVLKYSKLMKLSPHSLRFTQVRTYWGSCSPQGVISFNLKLARTSLESVEYVVVHELAHLKYRGHGKRFWNYVAKFYPRVKEVRQFLRKIPRTI